MDLQFGCCRLYNFWKTKLISIYKRNKILSVSLSICLWSEGFSFCSPTPYVLLKYHNFLENKTKGFTHFQEYRIKTSPHSWSDTIMRELFPPDLPYNFVGGSRKNAKTLKGFPGAAAIFTLSLFKMNVFRPYLICIGPVSLRGFKCLRCLRCPLWETTCCFEKGVCP